MLDNLSPEILEVIFNQDCLDIPDLINISSSCSYLRRFILENVRLWKSLYSKRWPEIAERSPKIENYLEEISLIYKLQRHVIVIFTTLTSHCLNKELMRPPDFIPFVKIIKSGHLHADYLVHYLKEILSVSSQIETYYVVPMETPGNLTTKYYSLKVLRYLGSENFKILWGKFITLQKEDGILEIGAALLMQWAKPQLNIKVGKVQKEFDKIAEGVINSLRVIHPKHPLLKVSEDDLNLWRNKEIKENKFSPLHCQQILRAIAQGISQDCFEKERDPSSFTLEEFESSGECFITRAVIVDAVARRLGVKLEWANPQYGFSLLYSQIENLVKKVYRVDIFNGGISILSRPTNVRSFSNLYSILTSQMVLKKFVSDLVRTHQDTSLTESILQLNVITHPSDVLALHALRIFYDKYNNEIPRLPFPTTVRYSQIAQTTDAFNSLSLMGCETFQELPISQIPKPPEKRNVNVKFAVGMVMKHKLIGYLCIIYGWNNTCDEKIQRQRESSYLGLNQPFYKVLLENGTRKYVAQENLLHSGAMGRFEKTLEVGKFFTHFFKNQFVPNYALDQEYPYDMEIRKRYQIV